MEIQNLPCQNSFLDIKFSKGNTRKASQLTSKVIKVGYSNPCCKASKILGSIYNLTTLELRLKSRICQQIGAWSGKFQVPKNNDDKILPKVSHYFTE